MRQWYEGSGMRAPVRAGWRGLKVDWRMVNRCQRRLDKL